jgi:hypothetical protein
MSAWKPAILSIKPFGKEYDRDTAVESRTGGLLYTVNLHRYTCTCPDFVLRRSQKPRGDLGRTCKHLREAVLALDTDTFGDELTRVIFKSPHGPYDVIWFAPGPAGDIVALGLKADKPWMNLFVRSGKGEPYTRYGYHPGERRWAYGSAPPGAHEILEMMSGIPESPGPSPGGG